ncbi:hypothetical protein [Azotobacter beijerinckii]|uniref:hypothetical protein n=1 Tax=Azotobacter beijerinckii TaxID=170623 RepID=UPI003CC7A29D
MALTSVCQGVPSERQSPPKLAVRAKAYELQPLGILLPVDQHQVRLDVAVALVFPVASQRMVTVSRLQRLVIRQKLHHRKKAFVEICPILAFAFALVGVSSENGK